jgi:hypothetical protein
MINSAKSSVGVGGVIFDEAQRAWDAEVGQELMGRPNSEPELFSGSLGGWSGAASFALSATDKKSIAGKVDCASGVRLWLAKPQTAIDGEFSLRRRRLKAGQA